MKELKKRLTSELQQNLHIEIKDHQQWSLPIQSLKVDFDTVQQSKMDVLMKMLLTAFRASVFQNSEQLSEMLLVEPLFIENVIQKMTRANLIEKNEQHFKLTEKGEEQLASGIFINLPEDRTEHLLFSPCHERFLGGQLEEHQEELDEYRYYDEYSSWDIEALEENMIREILEDTIQVEEAAQVQTVISSVQAIIPLTMEFIPCLEFQLYNKEEDIFYARIWNTLLSEWDETLEGQVNERERKTWREVFS